jgi:hypothetical protein
MRIWHTEKPQSLWKARLCATRSGEGWRPDSGASACAVTMACLGGSVGQAQTPCFPKSAAFLLGTLEEPQTCKKRRSALPSAAGKLLSQFCQRSLGEGDLAGDLAGGGAANDILPIGGELRRNRDVVQL